MYVNAIAILVCLVLLWRLPLLLLLLLLQPPVIFFFHPPIMQRSAAKWESAEEHTFIHIHSALLLCKRNCYTFIHYEAIMKSSRFSIKMTRTTSTMHTHTHHTTPKYAIWNESKKSKLKQLKCIETSLKLTECYVAITKSKSLMNARG